MCFSWFSRGLGMSKMFVTLWAGKISIWDIEKVREEMVRDDENGSGEQQLQCHLSASWSRGRSCLLLGFSINSLSA